MIYAITLFSSLAISFLSHQFSENFLRRNGSNVRLIIRNYQVHHSFWGMAFIAFALFFATGHYALAMVGYGLGNLWQHKLTHNRVNEKGLVFISRVK